MGQAKIKIPDLDMGGNPSSTTYLRGDGTWATVTATVYPAAGIPISTGTAWGTSITDNSTNWNTAYNDKINSAAVTGTTTKTLTLTQQDGGTVTASWTDDNTGGVTTFSGGTTGLTPNTATSGAVTLAGTLIVANGGTGSTTASGARTNLGATTVGGNIFTLANPGAITFPRFNADNTVSALDAASFRTAIGAGTSSTTGTVTSVAALTLGTTGTDLSSTVATGTTTPVITLNVPTASATNRGALSAADWTTFNSKQNALTNPVTGTGTTNYIPKFTGSTAIGNSAIYDNSGNIGIGITGATQKLVVDGGTTDAAPIFAKSSLLYSGKYYSGILAGYTTNTNQAVQFGYIYDSTTAANSIAHITAYGSAEGSQFAMRANGNIQIGTTTDAGYKLDVNGTGRFVNQLKVYNLLSENQIKGSQYIELSPDQATYNAWNIRLGAQAADNCYYITGGGVNILTTEGYNNPYTVKLYSNGVQTLTMTNGASTFSGTVTATGFFNSSDNRLKDLIDYDYNVSDIKPITYFWKDGRDNKKHVGYSAQEVQKVMPDAVNEGKDGMLSVNYVEVLVAKIAELENRIKQLEK